MAPARNWSDGPSCIASVTAGNPTSTRATVATHPSGLFLGPRFASNSAVAPAIIPSRPRVTVPRPGKRNEPAENNASRPLTWPNGRTVARTTSVIEPAILSRGRPAVPAARSSHAPTIRPPTNWAQKARTALSRSERVGSTTITPSKTRPCQLRSSTPLSPARSARMILTCSPVRSSSHEAKLSTSGSGWPGNSACNTVATIAVPPPSPMGAVK